MASFTAGGKQKFSVSLDPDLVRDLDEAARQDHRSRNFMLEKWLRLAREQYEADQQRVPALAAVR